MKKTLLLVIGIVLSISSNAQGWGDPTPYDENYNWESDLSEWISNYPVDNEGQSNLKEPDNFEHSGGSRCYTDRSEDKIITVGYNVLKCEIHYFIVVIREYGTNNLVSRKAFLTNSVTTCTDPMVEYSRHSIHQEGDNVQVNINGEAPENEMGFKRVVSLHETIKLN